MSDFRDRIRERLKKLGKTPRAASLAAGLSADALYKVLKLTQHSPTIATIEKVASALETTPAWLLFGISDVGSISAETEKTLRGSLDEMLRWLQVPEGPRSQLVELVLESIANPPIRSVELDAEGSARVQAEIRLRKLSPIVTSSKN